MVLRREDIYRFRKKIFTWWAGHKRDLPWRKTDDPYRILVSEIMLQQTQVARVIPKYHEFLRKYPTVSDLAKATSADVLRIWKGLGYNRRALNLKKTAAMIMSSYDGKIPENEAELLKLPGMGIYTTRALLVFAFRNDTYCVDTNIRKIIEYTYFHGQRQKEPVIADIASQLLPKGRSWDWHQALMDYGAMKLPKVKNRQPGKPLTKQFIGSSRYFRGRVVDFLREATATEDIIHRIVFRTNGKSLSYTRHILTGLERHGLITRSLDGIISLPD